MHDLLRPPRPWTPVPAT